MPPARRPFPGRQPPTTTAWVRKFLTLTHSGPRTPGRYGASSRLATTPSSPFSRLAAAMLSPPPANPGAAAHPPAGGGGGRPPGGAAGGGPPRPPPPLPVGEVQQVVTVQGQQVEDEV